MQAENDSLVREAASPRATAHGTRGRRASAHGGRARRRLGSWLGLGLFLGLAACGGHARPFALEASQAVPGAAGEVTTSTGPNGNTEVKIAVKHLAPPERVAAGATVYVVWASDVAAPATAHNLGALRVDSDLRGKLETVTPLRSFALQITPEASPTVEAPMNPPVLQVRVTPER